MLEIVLSGFETLNHSANYLATQKRQTHQELQKLGLTDYAHNTFMTLPSGMQRLSLLARATVTRPPLLILDEPCQDLDTQNAAMLLRHLDHLCATSDITMIYITHRHDIIPTAITHTLAAQR